MQATELNEFNQAVAMAQAGLKREAYAILTRLARYQSDSSNLFLWIAFTSPDLNEARHMINKAGSIDPANPALETARYWLAAEEAKQAATPVTPPAFTPEPTPAPAAAEWPQAQPGQVLPEAMDPGVPPQPVMPPVEQKPRKSFKEGNGPFILLGVACVVVLAAAVYMILFLFTGDQIAADGLPVYQSATRMDLGSQRDQLNKLFEGVTFGLLKDIKFEVYTIRGSDKGAALRYYDAELKKQGWTYVPSGNTSRLAEGNSYVKDKKMFTVAATTPTDSNFTLTTSNLNVKPGELMLVVFTAEMSTDLNGLVK